MKKEKTVVKLGKYIATINLMKMMSFLGHAKAEWIFRSQNGGRGRARPYNSTKTHGYKACFRRW